MVVKKNNQFEISKNQLYQFPLVSIIIPVYNTEKYLKQCLDSVINQTYKNIEIICIDDCSTDNSYQILQEYQKKNNRIRIFRNKTTKLAGYCRNFGIQQSTGKYIQFVDSDDWIELNLVQQCINKLIKTNADICIFDYLKIKDNVKQYIKQCRENIEEDKITNIFNCVYPNPWSKIFNKKFIMENKIQFSENLHNCNDLYFVILAAIKAKKICYSNYNLYNYRVAIKNSSQTIKDLYPTNSIIAINQLFNSAKMLFNVNNIWNLYEFIYKQLIWNFNTINSTAAKNIFINELKKYNCLLKFPNKIEFAYKLKKLYLKILEITKCKNIIPKFSIIIPVYNTEKYLRQCLDSCINQTYKNIEIICVDDCSTDNSYKILQEYQKKDNRIKVFKTNTAQLYPGNLRNIALKYCVGDYILCVDSDDYIDIWLIYDLNIKLLADPTIDYILYSATPILNDVKNEKLIQKYNKFLMYYSKYDFLKINNKSGLEFLLSYDNNLIYSNCLHCIKQTIIINNKIEYVNDVLFEDELFTRETLQYAKNVLILQTKLYYRRVHCESIMSNDDNILKKIKSIKTIIQLCKKCKNIFIENNINLTLISNMKQKLYSIVIED